MVVSAKMPNINLTHDRIRGCIIGGALGDAIGLFTEFFDANRAKYQYGSNPRFKLQPPIPEGYERMMMDQHRAGFEEGGWTDDTDQALLILMSSLQHGRHPKSGIDYKDFAKRLRHWVRFGFQPLERIANDVGGTVRSVVEDEGFLEDLLGMSSRVWERGGRFMAANGAVMRTPIIGALFFNDQSKLYKSAINVAAVTHADPRCLVSCTIASGLIAAVIRNEIHSEEDIPRVVESAISLVLEHRPPLEEHHIRELRDIISSDSLADLKLDETSSIGYTYKCLASEIWALREGLAAKQKAFATKSALDLPSIFEKIITELTMAGGDSDTNGAVAGSLLGSLFGYSNLPPDWVQDLKHRDWLLSKVDAAIYLSLGEGTPYDSTKDQDNLVDGKKGEMTQEEVDKQWNAFEEMTDKRIVEYAKQIGEEEARKP